jgi:hypothetical protein
MTSAATGERYAVRVMVTSAWETVPVQVDPGTTIAQLKHAALKAALKTTEQEDAYIVKFRGAAVADESLTLGALGAGPSAPFIVLPARRQPVR